MVSEFSRVVPARLPRLGVHKASGQARAVLQGRSFYFGKAGPNAAASYRKFLVDYLQTGEVPPTAREVRPEVCQVADLVAAFLEEHATYYVGPDKRQTGELRNYREAFKVLLALAARLRAADFSPRWFEALQKAMIKKGWCRRNINDQVRRVKRLFKWGVKKELVPPAVHQGALCVEGLKRFRSDARESEDVRPVPQADVDAVLPHLRPMVAAMVNLQLLTGMRVSEVLQMRGAEMDRSGAVWIYRPVRHKTQHCGRDRVVMIGPRAQEVLAGWLVLDRPAAIFSPRRSEQSRAKLRRQLRKTKVQPSQVERAELSRARQAERESAPGEVYTVAAYRRAIARACEDANVETWAPARLRHNAAERMRKEFGVEVARCVLGHADVRTTQLYSSFDVAKATDAAAKLG